ERTTKREVSAAGARGTHHLRRGRRRIAGTQRFTPEDARSNGFLPAESLQRSQAAALRSLRMHRGDTALYLCIYGGDTPQSAKSAYQGRGHQERGQRRGHTTCFERRSAGVTGVTGVTGDTALYP
ncbi:MAG: hypothetical protein ACK6EB_39145, partial [Planctomyces sp.]